MQTITLNIPQGVGDIFWIVQKFAPYYDRINLNVLTLNNACPVQGRSMGFLKLFPKVGDTQLLQTTPEHYQHVIEKTFDQRQVMAANHGQPLDYGCNKPLEEGIRLEDIDPGLEVAWDLPVEEHYAPIAWKDYVCLYVCGTNKAHGVWSVKTWGDFVERLYQKLGISYPLAVIGAKFDEATVSQVTYELKRRRLEAISYLPYPGNTTYLLRNALAYIGYQSGLSILADNCNTPQIMMYFDKLDKLPWAWPKQANIDNGSYRPFFFKQKPEDIIATLGDFQLRQKEEHVLLTCGIGDFIALESHLTPQEKEAVSHIFYATRQEKYIRELLTAYPAIFPNLRHQVSLFQAFTGPDTPRFCVETKDALKKLRLLVGGVNLATIKDWGVMSIGQESMKGPRKYRGSAFHDDAVPDLSKFQLPKKYVAIHPYSENAPKDFRDLSAVEWTAVLEWLEANDLQGVVINRGDTPIPHHHRLKDLTNRTTLMESFQIVRGSFAFVGASSCFSVLAAKALPAERLFIKGNEALRKTWYAVYYAPHTTNEFVHADLGFLRRHQLKPTDAELRALTGKHKPPERWFAAKDQLL